MNSIIEVKSKSAGGTILRLDVFQLINAYLLSSQPRFGTIIDIGLIQVFCDGREQFPPPERRED